MYYRQLKSGVGYLDLGMSRSREPHPLTHTPLILELPRRLGTLQAGKGHVNSARALLKGVPSG